MGKRPEDLIRKVEEEKINSLMYTIQDSTTVRDAK
jgi:hypothetical protein